MKSPQIKTNEDRAFYREAFQILRTLIEPGSRKNLLGLDSLHTACRFGLCPEGGLPMKEDGWYKPTPIQVKMWRMFCSMVDDWLPAALHGEPFDLLLLGELQEGVHHGSTTPITMDLGEQKMMSLYSLDKIIEKLKKHGLERMYCTIGSRVHSGSGGTDDESVAQQIGCVPDKTGRYARDCIKLRVGNYVVYGAHYIGGTRSPWYETTALNRAYAMACYMAGRWNKTLPDFILYGHRHQYVETRYGTHKGFSAVSVVPGWQAKTPYLVQQVDPFAEPQFGSVLIRQGDQDAYTRPWVRCIEEEADDIE